MRRQKAIHHRADALRGRIIPQHGHDLHRQLGIQVSENLNDAPGRPKPCQRLELRNRIDEFGFIVGILVQPLRGIERNTRQFLGFVAGFGTFLVRMYLQGQRAFRGDELHQIGQARSEALHHRSPQRAHGVGRNPVLQSQGVLLGLPRGVEQNRGRQLVGAEPHFCQRLTGRTDAKALLDSRI